MLTNDLSKFKDVIQNKAQTSVLESLVEGYSDTLSSFYSKQIKDSLVKKVLEVKDFNINSINKIVEDWYKDSNILPYIYTKLTDIWLGILNLDTTASFASENIEELRLKQRIALTDTLRLTKELNRLGSNIKYAIDTKANQKSIEDLLTRYNSLYNQITELEKKASKLEARINSLERKQEQSQRTKSKKVDVNKDIKRLSSEKATRTTKSTRYKADVLKELRKTQLQQEILTKQLSGQLNTADYGDLYLQQRNLTNARNFSEEDKARLKLAIKQYFEDSQPTKIADTKLIRYDTKREEKLYNKLLSIPETPLSRIINLSKIKSRSGAYTTATSISEEEQIQIRDRIDDLKSELARRERALSEGRISDSRIPAVQNQITRIRESIKNKEKQLKNKGITYVPITEDELSILNTSAETTKNNTKYISVDTLERLINTAKAKQTTELNRLQAEKVPEYTRTINGKTITVKEHTRFRNPLERLRRLATTEVVAAYNIGRLRDYLESGVTHVIIDNSLEGICNYCAARVQASLLKPIKLTELIKVTKSYSKIKDPANWLYLPFHPYCKCFYRPVKYNEAEPDKPIPPFDFDKYKLLLGTGVLLSSALAVAFLIAPQLRKVSPAVEQIAKEIEVSKPSTAISKIEKPINIETEDLVDSYLTLKDSMIPNTVTPTLLNRVEFQSRLNTIVDDLHKLNPELDKEDIRNLITDPILTPEAAMSNALNLLRTVDLDNPSNNFTLPLEVFRRAEDLGNLDELSEATKVRESLQGLKELEELQAYDYTPSQISSILLNQKVAVEAVQQARTKLTPALRNYNRNEQLLSKLEDSYFRSTEARPALPYLTEKELQSIRNIIDNELEIEKVFKGLASATVRLDTLLNRYDSIKSSLTDEAQQLLTEIKSLKNRILYSSRFYDYVTRSAALRERAQHLIDTFTEEVLEPRKYNLNITDLPKTTRGDISKYFKKSLDELSLKEQNLLNSSFRDRVLQKYKQTNRNLLESQGLISDLNFVEKAINRRYKLTLVRREAIKRRLLKYRDSLYSRLLKGEQIQKLMPDIESRRNISRENSTIKSTIKEIDNKLNSLDNWDSL